MIYHVQESTGIGPDLAGVDLYEHRGLLLVNVRIIGC